MADEWGALEHYLRVGAGLLADAPDDEVAKPVIRAVTIEESAALALPAATRR